MTWLMGALTWLGDTSWSMALRESVWAYPIVATAHVASLLGFTGLAFVWDLQLLGVGAIAVPIAALWQRVSRWLWFGFAFTATSGTLLFAADPVRFAGNRYFQAKLALLAIVGTNVAVFHLRQRRLLESTDDDSMPDGPARVAAGLSLLAWTAILVAGRLIAFVEP